MLLAVFGSNARAGRQSALSARPVLRTRHREHWREDLAPHFLSESFHKKIE